MQEIASIGGSYPKARSAELDAISKWGRKLEVKTSYSPMFISEDLKNKIINLLREGANSEAVVKILKMKPSCIPHIRAIKAHITRGTYKYKGII